jgi:hypothetical protein
VLLDERSGGHGVGGVGHDRGEAVTELVAQLGQPGGVAGQADDLGAGTVERDSDRATEATAGSGDECGRAGDLRRCHVWASWSIRDGCRPCPLEPAAAAKVVARQPTTSAWRRS